MLADKQLETLTVVGTLSENSVPFHLYLIFESFPIKLEAKESKKFFYLPYVLAWGVCQRLSFISNSIVLSFSLVVQYQFDIKRV